MPLGDSPISGLIAVEPLPAGDWPAATDDSSLGALLCSLAHAPALAAEDAPVLVASTRWLAPDDGPPTATIRADLARLLDDLQDQYDQLADRLG
ncbi:MAG: hypothetical protein SFU86_06670 [Pirellulaceae bacterium]|nr:hypothetical protein [Pirellulaceae bacterium]